MSISDLSPEAHEGAGPREETREETSVGRRRIGHFPHLIRGVEQRCEQQPHHAVVLILTDEHDVWTSTVRCDAWTLQDLERCERVVQRSASQAHRIIIGLYDTAVAGRRWAEACAQRWPNIVMAYAVEESRWFSNSALQEGGHWAPHYAAVRSTEPVNHATAHYSTAARAASVGGVKEAYEVPECAKELFREAYPCAQRERDRALMTGIWHMVDVWEWVLKQHEIRETQPGPHSHTSDQYVGVWTHSLVHVVAAVCAQLEVTTERERMIQQITVPCKHVSEVEYREVFTGQWGGPMSADGLRAHRSIIEYACTMITATGRGPLAIALAMLAWIEWALGNRDKAMRNIEEALRYESQFTSLEEAPKLSTFVRHVKEVLEARAYPRWIERPPGG